MQYRPLGKTGLSASVIGFGCNKIADPEADRKEVEATLETALDHGITLFDTADAYSNGESERLLGRLFRGRRDKVILCSKAGYRSWLRVVLEHFVPVPHVSRNKPRNAGTTGNTHRDMRSPRNFAPRILKMAIEGSLRRLQTDYLDAFYLHSPPPELATAPEVLEALRDCQKKGWIRHYGISFFERVATAEVVRCAKNPGISILQFQVNPRESIQLQPIVASAAGAAIVARQPFGRGEILSVPPAPGHPPPAPGRTLAQAILQSVLQQEGVHSVLVGMRSRKHLLENLGALEAEPLPASVLQKMYEGVRLY